MKIFKKNLKIPKDSKHAIRILLAIILVVVFYFTLQAPDYIEKEKQLIYTDITSTSTQERAPQNNLPYKLSIPRLNISSRIQHVGLTPEGLMEVPSSYTDVAWYKAGKRPGEIGSSVIAGHFGTDNAVFRNLKNIKIGDALNVQNKEGKSISFVVKKIEQYTETEDATQVFLSNDGKSHLNLITCYGVWSKTTKSYPTRLIVFADKK